MSSGQQSWTNLLYQRGNIFTNHQARKYNVFIDAYEGRHVATVDIKGAFLKA